MLNEKKKEQWHKNLKPIDDYYTHKKAWLNLKHINLDSWWRAPKSRGETNFRVSQSQVAEVETW
jgi:hypothetical protein